MLRRAMCRLPLTLVLAAVFPCAVAACSQDAGEACQVDRDCASGLICNRALGSSRGQCVAPGGGTGGTGGSGGAGGRAGSGGAGGLDQDAGGMSSDDAGASDADGG